jgi:hypothetical protein
MYKSLDLDLGRMMEFTLEPEEHHKVIHLVPEDQTHPYGLSLSADLDERMMMHLWGNMNVTSKGLSFCFLLFHEE